MAHGTMPAHSASPVQGNDGPSVNPVAAKVAAGVDAESILGGLSKVSRQDASTLLAIYLAA